MNPPSTSKAERTLPVDYALSWALRKADMLLRAYLATNSEPFLHAALKVVRQDGAK